MKPRHILALGLALAGALAVTGLRHTFGTGKPSPELERDQLRQSVYELGRRAGARSDAGLIVAPSELLAEVRRRNKVLDEDTPRRRDLRVEFARGYEDGVRMRAAVGAP